MYPINWTTPSWQQSRLVQRRQVCVMLSYENLQGALLELGNFFFFPGRVGIRQRKGTIRSEVRAGGAFRERRLPTHLRRLSTRSTTPLAGTPMHAGDSQAFRSKMLETKNETKEETNPRE
jgi:hypothetical protein